MENPDKAEAEFNSVTARLLRREALRRAAEELNTTSGPGLESVLARISEEVTAEAAAGLLVRRPARPPT
jgi:phage shock protein A